MWDKITGFITAVLGAGIGSVIGVWFTHDVQVRELELKQVEQIDKYVDVVLDSQNPSRRHDIALFFSNVSISDDMRAGWNRYLGVVDKELTELKRQKEEITKREEQKTAELATASGDVAAAKLTELSSLRAKKEEINASLASPGQQVVLTPRIYIHIRDETQRPTATTVAKSLYDSKFIVPGIERVATGPSTSELRYFRKAEEPTAQDLAALIDRQMPGRKAEVVYIPGHEDSTQIRQNHFELWLAP